jgi:REP element-mobilizing transposase RayT
MAIRKQHPLTQNTWFVTFTCYNWLPLFENTKSYDVVYKWLKLIDTKYQIKTLAFVIMPNHVHLILHLPTDKLNLNTIIGNAKRFIAYDFVKRLGEQNETGLLSQLADACSDKEKAKGQKHKGFQLSFDAKEIYSLPFFHQKLDYIHHNPVSGKWKLCHEYTDYPHSSAAFYVDNKPHEFVSIADYRDYWF